MLTNLANSPGTRPAPPPAIRPDAGPAEMGLRNRTGVEPTFPVLVVDDQPAWQDLVALYLGEVWSPAQGLAIDFAEDGAVALAKVLTKQFAAIILDWNLPVLGKGEVLRQLRRRGIHTPVIIISSVPRGEIDDDLEAFDAAYVSKDQLSPATLEVAIAHACGCAMADNPQFSGRNLPPHHPVDGQPIGGRV